MQDEREGGIDSTLRKTRMLLAEQLLGIVMVRCQCAVDALQTTTHIYYASTTAGILSVMKLKLHKTVLTVDHVSQ
jgi:hypothetical protein